MGQVAETRHCCQIYGIIRVLYKIVPKERSVNSELYSVAKNARI